MPVPRPEGDPRLLASGSDEFGRAAGTGNAGASSDSRIGEDELLGGLLALREAIRKERASVHVLSSDGTLSFYEAIDGVVEMICTSASDAGDKEVEALSFDPALNPAFGHMVDDGPGESAEESKSPRSVSTFEGKLLADRHLHRRMMSRDGRQAAAPREGDALEEKKSRQLLVPVSHPIRKIMPYIPHLHAIYLKVSTQLSWLTDSKSSIEQKAVAMRIGQLLECLSSQAAIIVNIHAKMKPMFDDGFGFDESHGEFTMCDLLSDDNSTSHGSTLTSAEINTAITVFRLVLTILGDGACLVEKTHEEYERGDNVESEENYVKVMSYHNEMERMVKLNSEEFGGHCDTAMNQRGALAAIKLRKLSVGIGEDTLPGIKSIEENRGALLEELAIEKLKPLLDWIANVDVVLGDLAGPSVTSVMVPRNLVGKHDAVDFLLHSTIPDILSIASLDASENITAIVAAFIHKRRKLMGLIPQRDADIEEQPRQRSILSKLELYLLRKIPRKTRYGIALLSFAALLVLHRTHSIHPAFALVLSTVLTMALIRNTFLANFSNTSVEREDVDHSCDFIPDIPADYIVRDEAKRRILDKLLDKRNPLTSDATIAKINTGITILSGAPGIGKTTLACSVASDPAVKSHFSDGRIWLDFAASDSQIDYKLLVEMYSEIRKQLIAVTNSDQLASQASSFDPGVYMLKPESGDEDEFHLMTDLRRDFFAHLDLSWYDVLVVIDGIRDLSVIRWFQEDESSGNDNLFSSKLHVMVTSSNNDIIDSSSIFSPHWSRIVEIGLLSDDEAEGCLRIDSLGIREGSVDAKIARGRDWAYSPLSLKCFGRCLSGRAIVFDNDDVNDLQPIAASLTNRLALISKRSFSFEQDRTSTVIEECLDTLFSSTGGVGFVLKLCFSAFVALFCDPSTSLSEPYIPATIATIFWDGILNSEGIPVEYLMELEDLLNEASEGGGRHCLSRSSFVADALVGLGLLKLVSGDNGEKKKVRGYQVEHELLAEAGLKLQDLVESEDIFGQKQSWNVSLVHSYKEYLSGIGSRRDRWTKDFGYHEEQRFIMRHLVRVMLIANMGDKVLDLLSREGFILKRCETMGSLEATMQHIDDCEYLLKSLKAEGEMTTLSGKIVAMSSARQSLVTSFEILSNQLSQVPGHYIEDFIKASAGLYLIGKVLRGQNWNKEAFAVFQESVNLCHVVLTYDRENRNVVYRVLARALNNIGAIHQEKGDLGEAIKSFTESLNFSSSTSRGYKSVESDIMRGLQFLGEAQFLSGNIAAALKARNRCLIVIESMYGKDHLRYAEGLQDIGMIYIRSGKAKKAKKLFLQAINLRKSLHGPKAAEVAVSLHFLGMCYRDASDVALALETLNEAILIWGKVIQDDDISINQINYASSLHELGLLHRQTGDLVQALNAYKKALDIRKSFLGEQHEDTTQTLHNIGIVYCESGAHEEAMKAYARSLQLETQSMQSPLKSPRPMIMSPKENEFTNALWASKALRSAAPSHETLRARCIAMFGRNIMDIPCSAARVFACSSLMVDKMIRNEMREMVPSMILRDEARLMEWVESMLPLMQAAVQAEIAVDIKAKKGVDTTDSGRKLVRFCSFDFSSVTSPSDMAVGSNAHLEHSISAIEGVVGEINRLNHISPRSSVDSKTSDAKAKLLLVLHAMTMPSEGKSMRKACAKTMPHDNERPWPSERFIRASELYRAEIQAMIASPDANGGSVETAVLQYSPLRDRLSTQIGSAIRFHLRRLFDPLPMFFTLPSDYYEPPDLTECRAGTHEIVFLRPPDGVDPNTSADGEDGPAPLWDRPISHVFNLALQRVYAYFKTVHEVKGALAINKGRSGSSSAKFALSEASKRAFDPESKGELLSEAEVSDILRDIEIAHTCLSAARASKFITSLIKWPGVAKAAKEAGGWSSIESLATKLRLYGLDNDFEDEAHFSQLWSMEALILLLESSRSEMMTAARASQQVLQEMWKRFKKGSGKKKRRTAHETMIRQILLDDSKTAVFPQLRSPAS